MSRAGCSELVERFFPPVGPFEEKEWSPARLKAGWGTSRWLRMTATFSFEG